MSDTGPERIYRYRDLPGLTGFSLPHIFDLVARGEFPQPIRLGPKARGFLASEIAEWQAKRIAERDGEAA